MHDLGDRAIEFRRNDRVDRDRVVERAGERLILDHRYVVLEGDLLDLVWCVASAAYQDEVTARQVAAANGVETATVQANARALLASKDVALVRVPALPPPVSP